MLLRLGLLWSSSCILSFRPAVQLTLSCSPTSRVKTSGSLFPACSEKCRIVCSLYVVHAKLRVVARGRGQSQINYIQYIPPSARQSNITALSVCLPSRARFQCQCRCQCRCRCCVRCPCQMSMSVSMSMSDDCVSHIGTALRPPLLGAHAEGEVAAGERQPEAERNARAEQRRWCYRRRGRGSGAGEKENEAM